MLNRGRWRVGYPQLALNPKESRRAGGRPRGGRRRSRHRVELLLRLAPRRPTRWIRRNMVAALVLATRPRPRAATPSCSVLGVLNRPLAGSTSPICTLVAQLRAPSTMRCPKSSARRQAPAAAPAVRSAVGAAPVVGKAAFELIRGGLRRRRRARPRGADGGQMGEVGGFLGQKTLELGGEGGVAPVADELASRPSSRAAGRARGDARHRPLLHRRD